MIEVMRSTSLALAAVLVLSAAACESPAAPTNLARFSQTDLVVGEGAEAVAGSNVKVNYTGWLYNAARPDQKGAQFDSSLSEGRVPLEFTLGVGQVIPGWDQGLIGLRVGGQRRLVIPPSLAYGGSRADIIPPNATLIFDVELLEIVTAAGGGN